MIKDFKKTFPITVPLHSVGVSIICNMLKNKEIRRQKAFNLIIVYSTVIRKGEVSFHQIKSLCGISKNTVKNHIKFLEEKNIIKVSRRGRNSDRVSFFYKGKILFKNFMNVYTSVVDKAIDIFNAVKKRFVNVVNYSHLRDFFIKFGVSKQSQKHSTRQYWNCPSCGGVHKVSISSDGGKAVCRSCSQGYTKEGVSFWKLKEKLAEDNDSISYHENWGYGGIIRRIFFKK